MSVWLPADRTVPAGGEETNVPGTEEYPSSWVDDSVVLWVIAVGVVQVMTGVISGLTTSVVVVLAVA